MSTPEQQPAPSLARPATGIAVLWLIAWPLLYLALRIAAPFVPMPFPVLGSVLATVLFLLIPLLWLRNVSRMQTGALAALLLFVALALVWSELSLWMPIGLLRYIRWRQHPDALLVRVIVARPIADLALITAAAFLGRLVSRVVSDPKMLLPIAFVGALVDYWGVYMGTTAAFIKASPELVAKVSAAIPAFGSAYGRTGVQSASFVGFGDWMFLTLFLAVAFRYDLQPRRTFWALLAFLAPAMLIVIFGGLDYLPAIVPMALAVFAVNGRRLKLSREETFASVYALLLVAAMAAGYMLFTKHLGQHPPAAR